MKQYINELKEQWAEMGKVQQAVTLIAGAMVLAIATLVVAA